MTDPSDNDSSAPIDDEELFCPFCSVSMDGRDSYAHALTHGPEHILDIPANAVAVRRRKQLMDFGGVTLEDLEV